MNPIVFRIAVGIYLAMLVGLITTYIGVSLVDVEVAAYIQGPQKLIQGGPNAIRGFVMNAPTGRLFTSADTTFILDPGSNQVVVGTGRSQKHGYVHTTLDASTAAPGEHVLELRARHSGFDDFVTSTKIEVVAEPRAKPWEQPTSRISTSPGQKAERDPKSDWTGDLRVEPMDELGQIARGLDNRITLRVVDREGLPVQAHILFTKLEGPVDGPIPHELQSNAYGLVSLDVKPIGSVRWTMKATEDADAKREGEGSLTLTSVTSQFSLRMMKPFLTPGESVDGKVTTLHRSGGLMVDLFAGERWVFADAYAISPDGAGLRAVAPASVRPNLWRVQVYEDVFAPGNAWDSQWLAVSPDGQCRSAIDTTLSLLGTLPRHTRFVEGVRHVMVAGKPLSEPECNELLDALLRGFPPHFQESTLLINSKADDEKDLAEWKSEVKGWLHILIAIALLIAFAVVMVFVAQGVATSNRQQRAIELADVGMDGDSLKPSPWERMAHIGRAVIFIGTLVLFGAGLLMVLTFM